jgi:hypothetical protein
MRGSLLLLALLASAALLEQAKAADKSFQLKDLMRNKPADKPPEVKQDDKYKDKDKKEGPC